jgi:hypothetical protein
MSTAKDRRPPKGEFPYWFKDIVFLRLATERVAGMITAVTLRPGSAVYDVSWPDTSTTCHYDFELTTEYVPDFGTTEQED